MEGGDLEREPSIIPYGAGTGSLKSQFYGLFVGDTRYPSAWKCDGCKERVDLALRAAGRLIDCRPPQVGRHELDQVIHKAAQQPIAGKTNPGGVHRKQMPRLDRHQSPIMLWIQRHVSDDPHPESQTDIRLDHVRVASRERNICSESRTGKRLVQ